MTDQPASPSLEAALPVPPMVIPVRLQVPPRQPPPPPPARSLSWLRSLVWTFLAMALGFLFLSFMSRNFLGLGMGAGTSSLDEKFHSGNPRAADKIAIIRIDGVLMEGMTAHAEKQIETAAKDPDVKAVVVRINSPGGSITASDDLHRRLRELRNPTPTSGSEDRKALPLVVSMGAMAASGGYYIAMPAEHVMAEKTSITGSIGVYAAFPNIASLADKHGVRMNVIKAGDIKDSGSMFHPMTAQERELWQGLVDNAYARFLEVVEEGRPKLKGKLREPIPEESKEIADRDAEGMVILDAAGKETKVPFRRYRADGGIFTAQQAENYGLIDSIGYMQDAIKKAKEVAGLGDEYKAVIYDKQPSLFGSLLGGQAPSGAATLDPQKLAAAAEPRLWFLAPQSELAGVLAAMGQP